VLIQARLKKMSKIQIIALLSILFITACTATTERETPTQGNIQIAADPSVIRITQEFADGFNFLYQNAEVKVQSLSESEAINALMDAKVRMIVIPGVIPAEQEKALRSQQFTPHYQVLALDAIALIVHPDNHDTLLSPTVLRQILSG
jgi:phosphate transport system substrate-binding protein